MMLEDGEPTTRAHQRDRAATGIILVLMAPVLLWGSTKFFACLPLSGLKCVIGWGPFVAASLILLLLGAYLVVTARAASPLLPMVALGLVAIVLPLGFQVAIEGQRLDSIDSSLGNYLVDIVNSIDKLRR